MWKQANQKKKHTWGSRRVASRAPLLLLLLLLLVVVVVLLPFRFRGGSGRVSGP